MAGVARIPRSRGGVCGLLLVLLGAWGGLIPFIGPYFNFAYTPDKAWAYTSGRLYLSVVPGAAALLGGLFVLLTRSRSVGVLAGFLAVLGGAWFIVGYPVEVVVLKNTSIRPGVPVDNSASLTGHTTMLMFGEELAFFTGLGILIVLVGALAMGRFSMIAAKDAGEPDDYEPYDEGQGQPPAPAPGRPFSQDPFPPAQDQFPTASGQFPTASGQFPTASGQFPAAQPGHPASPDPFTPAQERFQATTGPFPPAQEQFPTAAGQFPPAQEQKHPPSDQFPTSTS